MYIENILQGIRDASDKHFREERSRGNKSYRYGQACFNTTCDFLAENYPSAYNEFEDKIRASNNDCFYDDDKVEDFYGEVQKILENSLSDC